MRTLLIVSTVVLVACSDNPQSTAPRSVGSGTTGSVATNLAPSTQSAVTSSSKPIDQVGFTKTAVIASPDLTILNLLPQDMTKSIWAACPVGTTIVGGGFRILTGAVTINASEPIKSSGVGVPDAWSVTATLDQNFPSATVRAWAVCAS